MTPAEWQEVKDVLAEALELPAGRRTELLDRRCGGNPALRREVEALLAASEADGLLDVPPSLALPAIAEGEVLGPYTIEAKVAAGGMGEVYRAFDARLGRRVAIKVLPAHLTDNAAALARFERETKALAALSHPNLLAIFDVGRHRGTAFAVMELLNGETLGARLGRGRLPTANALEIAIQAARGLAAAHEAGIVHRDLKPENLFVTTSGQVKILDLGIAAFTPARSGSGAERPRLTAEGMVVGTLGYMSPEQARGESCDHRSDLFSLGAVLYEMLTGQPAFPGDTPLAAYRAVLDTEPPPLRTLCPEAGPQLTRLVHRCLEKDPARRFQSASDLAFHLESLAELPSSPPEERTAVSSRRPWIAISLAALLAFGAASLVSLALRTAPPPPPRIEFFTHASHDGSPTASPDGSTVAFVSDRDGRSRIWLKQIATGDERALTEGNDSSPRFSPDGQMILFTRDEASGPVLYRVGLLGGEPQRIVSSAGSGDWSPDGQRVAFVREKSSEPHNNWSIGLVGVNGSGEKLFPPEHSPLSHLRWSPDGRFVWAVRRRSALGEHDDLLRVDLETEDKASFAAPAPGGRISLPTWVREGRALLFAQTGSVTGYLPASRVVLFAPESARSRTLFWFPSLIDVITPLGKDRLVFDAVESYQNLGESAAADGSPPQRWLTHGTGVDRQPVYSPDGRSLVFSSNRSGNIDLWQLSLETGALKRLAEHAADDWDPAFSPDGRRLVWSSNRNGGFEIFVAEDDGLNPRQLTRGTAAENPTVTADGQWVLYSSGQPGMDGVRRIRLDGTGDRLVTKKARGHPDVSPDGRHVVFRTHSINGVTTLYVAEVESGAVLPASTRIDAAGHRTDPRITLGRARWLPDGRGVAFIGLTESGHVALMAEDFDPRYGLVGHRRTLIEGLPDLLPESFGVAADGRLAVSFIRRSSNLMTASGLPLDEIRP